MLSKVGGNLIWKTTNSKPRMMRRWDVHVVVVDVGGDAV